MKRTGVIWVNVLHLTLFGLPTKPPFSTFTDVLWHCLVLQNLNTVVIRQCHISLLASLHTLVYSLTIFFSYVQCSMVVYDVEFCCQFWRIWLLFGKCISSSCKVYRILINRFARYWLLFRKCIISSWKFYRMLITHFARYWLLFGKCMSSSRKVYQILINHFARVAM